MVNVYSMTIFIKSIYRSYYNRFYPQIHLTNCIYKECQNTIELIFLKVLILKNVKKHLESVFYVNSYYFLDKNFINGPYLCNGCYDMSLKVISMQNLAIINHNGNYYRVNFAFISKKDAFNLIKNAVI